MRELKFRFWDKDYKSMTYDFAIKTKDGKKEIDIIVAHIPSYVSMQYIGLKDKTRKDAFEGDIIEYKYYRQMSDNPDDFQTQKGIAVIEYDCSFYLLNDKKNKVKYPMYFADLSFEIIGNIHENPELL